MSAEQARRFGTACLAVLVVGLFVITFLPWSTWLGRSDAEEVVGYALTLRQWLVWGAVILAAALVVDHYARGLVERQLERWSGAVLRIPAGGYAVVSGVAMLAVTALLASALYARNPQNVDSIAQLFQARVFLGGGLSAPAPENPEFFGATHLVWHGGRWFSQYPPGHAALLTLGLLVGLQWLVNPVVAGLTVALVYAAARALFGEAVARLSAALYVVSPFALLMSASHMNHVTTGLFLALALYGAVRTAGDQGGRLWPVVTGLALGLAASIRPLEAALWAAVLGIWVLYRGRWKGALLAGSTCLLALAPLLVYNGLTTGHPLRFGYSLLWGPGHGLGFHTDPWGEPFTPVISLANTALDFQRLNVLLFLWPFPSLLFVFVALAAAAAVPESRRGVILLAALLFAAPLGYFFYWHRDNLLGPRFFYASLTPAVVLTAAGVVALTRQVGRWRGAVWMVLIAGMAVAVAVNLPQTAGTLAGRMPERKLHPEVEFRRAGIGDALVFVKTGWGGRLISRLWAWGVPASETEQAYRVVDGCRLQTALDEADSLVEAAADSSRARAVLDQRLREWRAMDLPVARDVLADKSVRVDTSVALAERCHREAQRDETGYTVYGTLIWRNDPWLREGVIYARDFGSERNRRLVTRYPGRRSFLYAPLSAGPLARPVVIPLDDDVVGAPRHQETVRTQEGR
ncbi:MAG: glycosyltransferase family 39 protein [Gemmatimonadota bacterium]|nr:MAG: glycosyltransferase family 39 protein [Gemmatimonadota bacterium]